jgi:hypothetical protein
MRAFWEKVGVLGPVYRLVGQGFSDRDIAEKLCLSEVRVQECVIWILHFLGLTSRIELFRYAATPAVGEAGTAAGQVPFRISSGLVA